VVLVSKNKANLLAFGIMRRTSWFCHSCENRNPDSLTVLDSASSAEWQLWQVLHSTFEKTKPICYITRKRCRTSTTKCSYWE